MSNGIPAGLWKKLTSTVGLVSVQNGQNTNVMSAEWSYFVNKEPLYAAVVLWPGAATRGLITSAGEFSLTLCADDQAELADFAGSFTVADIDKATSDLLQFGTPETTTTPWVTGGLLAIECVLRQTVALPVHTMYIGEVVAAHLPAVAPRPLVKHGAMHALGEPLRRVAVAAAAQLLPGDILRVAATGPAGGTSWRVSLLTRDGDITPLGEHPTGPHGDFLKDLHLPSHLRASDILGAKVKVEFEGAKAGYAAIHAAPA